MDDVERGRQARRFLATDAFTDAEALLIEAWRSADSVEKREVIHARFVGLDFVRAMLEGYVGDVEAFEAQQPVDED